MSNYSAGEFVSRPLKTLKTLSDEEWMKVSKFQFHDYSTIADVNDPKYEWTMCVRRDSNDYKYGRMMVSFTQKIRRNLTMGEFYGSGEVD